MWNRSSRWPNDISSVANNAVFKNRAQNIECSFGCVACSAVLLIPNVANILLLNFYEQKFVQHGPITITIDCNGLSLLIFEEKFAKLCLWTKIRTKQWLVLDASAFQCMRAGFLCPKYDNFISKWASSQKMIRSQAHLPALFKRIHNHIRSAEE